MKVKLLWILLKLSLTLTSLILIHKYGFPMHVCNKHVNADLQTLLLAVVALVLFGLAVDQGDVFSASTLFFLSFFSVWKGGNHRKITIIIEDPVAGLQWHGAASCQPLHFCQPCMIQFWKFNSFFFFFSFRHRLSSCYTTFLSFSIPLSSYSYVEKFYTVVPGKVWIFNFLSFLLFFYFFILFYQL